MDIVGAQTLKIMRKAAHYNKWLFSVTKKYVSEPILEIGAGIGNFTSLLADLGSVTAVDIDRKYLSSLKKLKHRNIKTGFGDIESAKYFFATQGSSKEMFNSIVCMNVLEHIDHDVTALRNMNSLLKKKGTLVLLVPSGKFAFGTLDTNLGHFRRYSKEELTQKLGEAGFTIERMRYLNLLGIPGWWFNSKVLKRKVIPSRQVWIFDKISRPLLLLERIVKFPIGLSLLVIAKK